MHKFSATIRVLIYTFLIAIVINPIVISSHILTERKFDFTTSLNIILLSLGVSIAFFACICVLLFFVSVLFRKKTKGGRYWMMMLFAIIATTLLFIEFDNIFASYNDKPAMIAAISIFSIMVSLSSQYELFIDSEDDSTLYAAN